jgi:predicted HD phosphohydrolase
MSSVGSGQPRAWAAAAADHDIAHLMALKGDKDGLAAFVYRVVAILQEEGRDAELAG